MERLKRALFSREGASAVVGGVVWHAEGVSKMTMLAGALFSPRFKIRGEALEAISELSPAGLELVAGALP